MDPLHNNCIRKTYQNYSLVYCEKVESYTCALLYIHILYVSPSACYTVLLPTVVVVF